MTPIELYYRYKALRVPVDEHRTLDGLAVSRYLNPRPGSSTSSIIEEGKLIVQGINWQLRTRYREITGVPAPANSEAMTLPPDKLEAWYPALRNRPIRQAGNNRAFTARGSPEEIELALAAAASVSRLEILGSVGPEERVNQLVSRYIGLDCAGFAGNFFQACGYTWGSGPTGDTPPHSYATHGREIGLDQVVPGNAVLLFPRTAAPVSSKTLDCEHIAVVQTWAPTNTSSFVAVESCSGRGLAIGSYRRTGRGGVATTTWSGPGVEEHTVHELIHPATGREVYVVIRALLCG